MSYTDLYDKIDALLRDPMLGIVRRKDRLGGGAEWLQGTYTVRVRPAPRPYYVQLDRRGGRKKSVFYFDEDGLAAKLAGDIQDHFNDRRNTT